LKSAIVNLQTELADQKTITDVLTEHNKVLLRRFAESEKELNFVSETIMNRVMPIVDLFDSVEGLEDFLLKAKDKYQQIPSDAENELWKKIQQAQKKRKEENDPKFEFYAGQFIKAGRWPPKNKKTKETKE